MNAVKTVTLITIKVPVYLDSRESQLGEPHIPVRFSDHNRVCSRCALHRALSANTGSVSKLWEKTPARASMTPVCPRTALCFPPPYSQVYQSLRLEGYGSDSGVFTADCSLVLPLTMGDLEQLKFPYAFLYWKAGVISLHKVRVLFFWFLSCDLWWKNMFYIKNWLVHLYIYNDMCANV